MYPILFRLFGPFNINSYGFMIAIGVFLFTWLCKRNARMQALLTADQFNNAIIIGIIGGVIGGRLIHWVSDPSGFESIKDVLALWEGGFSSIGAILGIVTAIMLYCWRLGISALQLFDVFAIYAGLLQSISRAGCFLAGCCYGSPTSMPWAVYYTNSACKAPIYQSIHPAQLYSTIMLFIIFLVMLKLQHLFKKNGQLITTYLLLVSIERFCVDFVRGEQIFNPHLPLFSIDQWMSIMLGAGALISLIYVSNKAPQKIHESI